jgi:hypothetical protein
MRPVVLSENQQRQVQATAAMLRFESRHDFLLDVARYGEINCRVRAPTKKEVDDATSATDRRDADGSMLLCFNKGGSNEPHFQTTQF